MKKFFLDLINSSSPTSSKRFAGLLTLASILSLAFMAAYRNNGICPEPMYSGLLWLTAGLFGLNAAENIFKKVPGPIKDANQQLQDNTDVDEDKTNK